MTTPRESPLNPAPSKPDRDNRTVRIRLGDDRAQVEVGGRNITNAVTSLRLDAGAVAGGEEKTLTLDLRVERVDVEGTPTIRLPQATHDALVALGWTPPAPETPAPDRGKP